jgi:hypothetical protein
VREERALVRRLGIRGKAAHEALRVGIGQDAVAMSLAGVYDAAEPLDENVAVSSCDSLSKLETKGGMVVVGQRIGGTKPVQ